MPTCISTTCSIICPWHKYKIDAASGACLYIGIDIATRSQQVKSKGPKQRVHLVKTEGDDVYVADSSLMDVPPDVAAAVAVGKGVIASDTYAFRPFNNGTKEAPLHVPIHSSVGPAGGSGSASCSGGSGGGGGSAAGR